MPSTSPKTTGRKIKLMAAKPKKVYPDVGATCPAPRCACGDCPAAPKYIGDKKSEYWGTTGKAGDDEHPFHWNMCTPCWAEQNQLCAECHCDEDVEECYECGKLLCIDCDENEMATYGEGHECHTMCTACGLEAEFDDAQTLAALGREERNNAEWAEYQRGEADKRAAKLKRLKAEQAAMEREAAEEEEIHEWDDIKRFIVDESSDYYVVEYPGAEVIDVRKTNIKGLTKYAQPYVGEAAPKKEEIKHPAPAIKCGTMTLKEEAEKKGYTIYFSADKKSKQNYANQQRALGKIKKGEKSWDDYDHEWHSTKNSKPRRTIDEVDKLRAEVAELKAMVKTLMATRG